MSVHSSKILYEASPTDESNSVGQRSENYTTSFHPKYPEILKNSCLTNDCCQ